jgi:uncharacterized protein YqhQ
VKLPYLFTLAKECGQVLVGGQAVIEGVLMRLPESYAVAVRTPKNEIKIMKDKAPENAKGFLGKTPFVRGNIILFKALALGIKALNYSAQVAIEEEQEEETAKEKSKKETPFYLAVTLVISLAIGLLLFFYLPLLATQAISNALDLGKDSLSFNIIDGILRMIVFLIYLSVILLMKDIRRVFAYHGAEHKVVFTWEAKEELTVENARKHTRLHPRCGTSFLLFVMVVSIFFFTLVPHSYPFWAKALARIVFLPLIAGTSYELIRLTAKFPKFFLLKPLLLPGLALQYFFTTREPDDGMLEVALTALKEAQAYLEENKIAP